MSVHTDLHPLALAGARAIAEHFAGVERIRRHPAVAADAREELEEQLSQWFGGTAQHQLLRLVINDFHEFREERGWPPEPHRRVALDAYTQRLLAEPDAMNRIWEAAPRLQPKLTRLGAQALRSR